jgi:two-component system cell cycle sensor histidine kinase/response regulator CckA
MNHSPTQSPHRILVVDDNPSIHQDFHKILCPHKPKEEFAFEDLQARLMDAAAPHVLPAAQFEVDTAAQGQEALEKVRIAEREGRPYSLAFMDVRMPPGWDGIETIAHIWKEYPHIQVVICTAYSDYSWEEILRKLGESDSLVILKKPFDNVEVLQLAHALTKKWTVTRQANVRMLDLDEMVRNRTQELFEANRQLQSVIEHRERVETALRESEERFHKAFETASIALAIVRADTSCFAEVNQSFARLIGYDKAELPGRSARDLNIFQPATRWDEFLQALIAGKKIVNTEATINGKDGNPRQTLVSIEPLALNDQPCVLLAALDVTDQRQLEAQLRQSQKMEAIGQLAAGIAHDFNNVLTVIQGHTTVQLAKVGLDRDVAKSLEQVKIASERAAALTRQLLAFSRKQVVRRAPLDLTASLSRLHAMLARLLGETIRLEVKHGSDLPLVQADEISFEQVVMNLAVNARDAMPGGGAVRISTSWTEVDEAHVQRHPDARIGRYVVLSVSDTGCGMDENTLSRVFEPFFTTKPLGQGTGLGLSTVYGIVKQHEGWIEVDSKLKRGTTFRIFLPVSALPQGLPVEVPSAQPEELVRGKGQRILVAEDERDVREFVKMVLEDEGYDVVEAGSGAEALMAAKREEKKFHLLITDMVMPNSISGSVLAHRLLEKDRSLKVIYMSGYSPEVVASGRVLTEGLNFLAKPFGHERLLAAVSRALTADNQAVELPITTLPAATPCLS